ncbi:hypothetical protein BAUCODRAFT_32860 [Baudoinia panamericana UAMH 10762]|uniref:JmjC domain-containing protein n=1 Tax=Baudoinia panamericana (strain UAMH 10762) TaxID=717646 RepID=M2LRN4_BAUPA|nr:uncharacterized protein BAUCODRAFT_32860 [Baudoinia panamericana UAMH 10762]EMC97117.1 hypothetical protein BAUCODRAFT_32860 [Baudoinia panamericana UAMH 10762]
MPATRPRASFEPISPLFDLHQLVEQTPNFSFVDRISCDMIDQQGLAAFEKLVMLHVVVGGKPLVIDGYDDRLDPWTFSPRWLRDNCGEKVENARVLSSQQNLPLTMAHYLNNMSLLTNQFFEREGAYRDKNKQRVYLKDIDCPGVWQDKLKEQIPSLLFYLNDTTGEVAGPGALADATGKLGKGIARAGDLMSSLPPDMRAENLMCYIGHEGTYTPAHREMCASLGHNIMVEASGTVSEDGKAEKPGSSIWFLTESKERHVVSEYWLSVLGHDIEVENHFAQVVAWKKAPFNVHVVEQKPGDFILIPPLAPHQVWNRGTRTMKVAWNRTTAETLEMALGEALPRSRIVCRDEQYKNKAIVYYTLQKYSGLLQLVQQQTVRMLTEQVQQLLYSDKIKQLRKDFKKLFNLYKQILLSEMFRPDDRDAPRNIEYLPFDSNVTCAYCRGNIFNRFLSCSSCKDLLGHDADGGDGDPYDVCMDCYAMGRSCACLSNFKWVEQFKWKELQAKYEGWRKLIIALDGGQITDKTPLTLVEERKRYGRKTLAEVCKEQLKRRPWKDVHKPKDEPKEDESEEEEIVVGDDGTVKKITKKMSKTFLKNNLPCHVCCKRHPIWKMAFCTTCDKGWCYGSLFRGWDKMPMDIMEDPDWQCPHCLAICFAGNCRREGKMQPYEPKGTLLGHDTRKVADARSIEALVDFSISNLNWLKDDDAVDRTQSNRVKRAKAEAQKAKESDPALDEDEGVEQTQVDYEYSPHGHVLIDPELDHDGNPTNGRHHDEDEEAYLMRRLQQANSALPPPAAMVAGTPATDVADGYVPVAPPATMYPQPDAGTSYSYPGHAEVSSVAAAYSDNEIGGLRPFNKRRRLDNEDEDYDDINMQKHPKTKKPRMSAAGFKSADLADETAASRAKTGTQRQFQKEKERKALDKAKGEGRFIMLQAALRGKKRIVRLKVPGPRLAEALAREAVRAAQNVSEEADAEHEVEEGAAQERNDLDDANALLKSDVAPKKRHDPKQYHRMREEEGYVVTGNTRKAMVPVEKDDNYGFVPRERLPCGKRVAVSERKRKSRQSMRTYEEVDIGSDGEAEDGEFATTYPPAATRERRALPSYLQNRHADEDNLPAKLPHDRKDGRSRPRGRPSVTLVPNDDALGHAPPKLPGERPPNKLLRMGSVTGDFRAMIEAPDEDEANNMRDAAADGSSMGNVDAYAVNRGAIANTPKQPPAAASRLTSSARPRGRPTTKQAPTAVPAQRLREEQNRLAKLHALELVTGQLGSGGPGSTGVSGGTNGYAANPVNMADVLSDDDDEDDNGVDSVPARGPAAMQV